MSLFLFRFRSVQEQIFPLDRRENWTELQKQPLPGKIFSDSILSYKLSGAHNIVFIYFFHIQEISWLKLLNNMFVKVNISLTKEEQIVVWELEYYKKLMDYLSKVDRQVWKTLKRDFY